MICSSCGAPNQLPEDRNSMKCEFCGTAIERKIADMRNTNDVDTEKQISEEDQFLLNLSDDIVEQLNVGNKLTACILLRQSLNISLKEAKDQIDTIGDNKMITSEEVKELISKIQPNTDNSSSSNGCFIATATMGSYDHPSVVELRLFRDNWILEKSWGETFVKWYYHYGAIAAKFIEKSVVLKKFSYLLIVKPLVFLSRIVKK